MEPSLHKESTLVLQLQGQRLKWQREAEVGHSRGVHRLPAKAFSWQFISWWVKAGEDYPGMHWGLRMHSIGLASRRSNTPCEMHACLLSTGPRRTVLPVECMLAFCVQVHRCPKSIMNKILVDKNHRDTGILWVLYSEENVSVSCSSFEYK